ncbi:D-alanine--D-alanine ligase, partial [bacterium]|nr:D-alanine--D-alanine ligase [bacterium]
MRLALACNRNTNYKKEDGKPDDSFEEFDSPETVDALAQTIASFGHDVEILEADLTFPEALSRGRFSFVFNIAEGLKGRSREAQVPALCEMLGIPYSGSDPLTMGITLDKNLAKKVVGAQLPTPIGRIFRSTKEIDFSGIPFPIILKPNAEGSSKGVRNASRIDDPDSARALAEILFKDYSVPILAEEFLGGPECTVGVLGNANPSVISIMEISPKKVPTDQFVYSIESKRDYQN